MSNFFRVVRLTMRRRFTFALALLCSIGVALLWGANLGLVKPIIEIVFSDKPPHAWADAKVAEAKDAIAKHKTELAALDARIAKAKEEDLKPLHAARLGLEGKVQSSELKLKQAEYTRPIVHRFLPNDAFQTLVVFMGLLVVATLLKDAMLVGNMMLIERMTQLALLDVRNQLFRKTLAMEMARFGNDHTSHMMHRFTGDINCAFAGVNVVIGRMVLEPLKATACLIGAAMISWRLLCVSLLVAPIAVFVMIKLSQSLKRANRRAMEEMGRIYEQLSETLSGIQSVKAYGMERHERRKFHAGGKNYFKKAMKIVFYNAMGRASAEFMGMAILCMAIVTGAYLCSQHKSSLFGIHIMDKPLSLGSLMAFFALLLGVSDPARKLAEVMNVMQRGVAAADRLYLALDRKPTIVDPHDPKFLATDQPELVFDHVTFHYVPGQSVLRDVNLRIPFGETVAIVGPNGCGKSTLVNLLLRFFDPIQGAVRMDGIDLRELKMREVRGLTGLVAQQAMLFDDTVMNNIRYGSPHATDEEVIAASEKAFAHRFVLDKLENGYDTVVGERGGKLSGGQRQRVMLARAILRDPKFLILDEATSQIDLESEQLIHRVLEQFTRGRTTLLITHRMSSIELADRIVVMDHGQIIDVGPHHELVRRCDLYERLHSLGFKQTA